MIVALFTAKQTSIKNNDAVHNNNQDEIPYTTDTLR
jgi:hypothetical protein